MNVLKEFAKSPRHFYNILQKNKARIWKEYHYDVSKINPNKIIIEKGKQFMPKTGRITKVMAFKGKTFGEDKWGNWNEYVKDYEGIHPKGKEQWHEYNIALPKKASIFYMKRR